MNRQVLAATVVLLGAVLSASHATADVIYLGSSVSAYVDPQANADSEPANQQQSQGMTLSTLAASVTSTAQGPNPGYGGYATVTNYAAVTESFNDSYSGVVQFGGVGWDNSASDSDGGVDSEASSVYAFSATGDTELSVSYDTSGLIDTNFGSAFSPRFGISVVYYQNGYSPGGDYSGVAGSSDQINIGDSGTFDFEVTQPGDYGILIDCGGGYVGGLPTDSADAMGTFDFSIPSAVPEPASVFMLGMGAVGVIGYSRIRRRAATKFA